MSSLSTRDMIISLKEIKTARNLTPQKIFDIMELTGYHISLNTIKKIFDAGGEDGHYHHSTVEPIYRVLQAIYGNRANEAEISALLEDIRAKDKMIAQLEQERERDKADYSRRVDFLMEQIRKKDDRIDILHGRVTDVLLTNKEVIDSNRELMAQIQRLIETM